MSKLSKEQVQILVGLISTTEPDEMSCDDCYGRIGEFAEMSLEGRELSEGCLLYTSPSPRDATLSRMPSSA